MPGSSGLQVPNDALADAEHATGTLAELNRLARGPWIEHSGLHFQPWTRMALLDTLTVLPSPPTFNS
jgi:hypothetical protein